MEFVIFQIRDPLLSMERRTDMREFFIELKRHILNKLKKLENNQYLNLSTANWEMVQDWCPYTDKEHVVNVQNVETFEP